MSDIAYADFGIREGDKVLDIGCGFGETALEIAKIVGPSGEIVGIDCTDAFVGVASQERDEAGVMFFESAVRALRNAHHALKPGGKVCLIVREAGEEGQRKLPEIRRDLRELMSSYLRPDGVFMPSSTWAIMARKA